MITLKNKVNEWQELSLKKDIEKISRVITRNKLITSAFIFDIAIAVIAIVIDKFLSPADESNRTWLFWALFVMSLVPFVVILLIAIRDQIRKRNGAYNVYSVSELIDSFDNDICYYVMMANTYNQMLNDSIKHGDNNVAVFYYIETWYYVNKAKSKMHKMLYKTKQIFTKEPNDVLQRNMISISRLVNIIMIIEDIRVSSNKFIDDKSLVLTDKSIVEINREYDKSYRNFISKINENFNSPIKINFDDKNRFSV